MIEYYKNLSLESLFYINEEGLVCLEEWRDVVGYEGMYEISNLGRVKSLKKTPNLIFKIQTNTHGYNSVCLSKNGKVKTFPVHYFVGCSFLNYLSFDSKKYVVDHIDNIKKNCTTSNLQVITYRENSSKDQKNRTSKYTGVCWNKKHNVWTSSIYHKQKTIKLGCFKNEEEAYEYYVMALKSIKENTPIIKKIPDFSSSFKGVSFHRKTKKWRAFIIENGKQKHLGLFSLETEAGLVAEKARKNLV